MWQEVSYVGGSNYVQGPGGRIGRLFGGWHNSWQCTRRLADHALTLAQSYLEYSFITSAAVAAF
jgi:hypothetical protein